MLEERGELWVHYRNLNRAGASEGCVSQIVWCLKGRLMVLLLKQGVSEN